MVSLHVRQEALSADLAQVQEEYANSKDNSRKTIQVRCLILNHLMHTEYNATNLLKFKCDQLYYTYFVDFFAFIFV